VATNEQELKEVEAALRNFYLAIDDLVTGKGLARMEEVWEHSDRVTGKHPIGDWCVGWDEVNATWQVTSSFGRPEHVGARLISTRILVYGELAYATSVFQAAEAWGGERLLCTNILHKTGGSWKMVHHHADPSPKLVEALERMAAQG
jgi:ketosteroid isomerase-like protein